MNAVLMPVHAHRAPDPAPSDDPMPTPSEHPHHGPSYMPSDEEPVPDPNPQVRAVHTLH